MNYGERPDRMKYRSVLGEVSAEDARLFHEMAETASSLWWDLTMGWERRRRPNEDIDLSALQSALDLEALCVEALERRTVFLHPNTNQLRYSLYAATLMVPRLLPIAEEDRSALRTTMDGWHSGFERWEAEPPEHHRPLIKHWREWLRSDGTRRVAGDVEMHGEASLLAAASYQMGMALHPGPLGFLPELEPDIPKLVLPIDREPWRYLSCSDPTLP